MRAKIAVVLLALLVLSACAAQEPLKKITASGYPEATFIGKSQEDIKGLIIQRCLQIGKSIEDATQDQVVCTRETDGAGSMLATLMLGGNAYSSNPVAKTKFFIFKEGNATKVIAKNSFEANMAGGRPLSKEVKNNTSTNSVQDFLFAIGGE